MHRARSVLYGKEAVLLKVNRKRVFAEHISIDMFECHAIWLWPYLITYPWQSWHHYTHFSRGNVIYLNLREYENIMHFDGTLVCVCFVLFLWFLGQSPASFTLQKYLKLKVSKRGQDSFLSTLYCLFWCCYFESDCRLSSHANIK